MTDKVEKKLNVEIKNEKSISSVVSERITKIDNFNTEKEQEFKVKIKIIGAGGAGGNAINDMITNGIEGVEFIAVNTDLQDLKKSMAETKLQIGTELTKGLGAGADPEIGAKAAEENRSEIKEMIKDVDMLFITAGMGGGTGTGAAPVIAEIANQEKILTIAVVSKPFGFEGEKRKKNSEEGIEKLKKYVDTIVVIPNDKLFELGDKKITFKNAFKEANQVLFTGVKGIAELVTVPGFINIDFADVKTIVKESGLAMLGFGEASGDQRAINAAKLAISNPLLEKSIYGAKRMLFNIAGGEDLAIDEIQDAVNFIKEKIGDIEANVIFGAILGDEQDENVRITLIATDFEVEGDTNINKRKSNTNLSSNVQSNVVKNELNDSDFDNELDLPAFIRRKR